MKTGTGSIAYSLSFEELIFSNKNKNYGAYVLRKSYSRYLIIACFMVIILFSIGVSLPLLLKKELPVQKKITTGVINIDNIPMPGIEKPKDIEPIKPPIKTTVKFTVPQVKPDALVTEGDFPEVSDLANVDPGLTTQIGTDIDIIENPLPPVIEEAPKEQNTEYTWVEEMPGYPGGNETLLSFIAANLKYPTLAVKAGVEGKVIISYIIEKDGGVTDIQILKGIGAGCDEEAIRVISLLNKWTPGRQNGHAVRVRMMIPIVFKLRS